MSTSRSEFGAKAGLTVNRIAILLGALAALAAGIAPVLADMDWTSTAGIIAGISSITALIYKWLDGWQKFEARHDVPDEIAAPPAGTTYQPPPSRVT